MIIRPVRVIICRHFAGIGCATTKFYGWTAGWNFELENNHHALMC